MTGETDTPDTKEVPPEEPLSGAAVPYDAPGRKVPATPMTQAPAISMSPDDKALFAQIINDLAVIEAKMRYAEQNIAQLPVNHPTRMAAVRMAVLRGRMIQLRAQFVLDVDQRTSGQGSYQT